MQDKLFHVYMLASRRNGTIYTGMTSNLLKRVHEHQTGVVDGFTRKYGVKMLVWYERHDNPESAIMREKQIKRWQRAWKIEAIETMNPDWVDLYEGLIKRANG